SPPITSRKLRLDLIPPKRCCLLRALRDCGQSSSLRGLAMHVTLPVPHKVEARRKHHRTHEACEVYSYATFDIPEITSDDAPVVLQGFERPTNAKVLKRSRTVYGQQYGVTFESNPTGILRYHDNSLWYPEYNGDNVI